MGQAERIRRRARRRERIDQCFGRVKEALRPLDEDDKAALTVLLGRGAEILGDGQVSPSEIEELAELVESLREARSNTPPAPT